MRRAVASLAVLILAASVWGGALRGPAARAAGPDPDAAAATTDHLIGGFEDAGEDWQLSLGPEFPGASGDFSRDDSASHSGSFSGRTHADFGGGGNYVEAFRGLESLDIQTLSFWVRTSDADQVGLRLTDSTGQVHQQQLALAATTDWQRVDVTSLASPSHWGGANDGVWHGPATRIGLITDKAFLTGGRTSGDVWLDDVVARVPVPDLVIRQTKLGNVFTDGEPVAFDVDTTGAVVSWSAHDFWGAEVASGTETAQGGTASVRPAISHHGYYTLDLTARHADGSVVATASTTFALLSPFDVKAVHSSPFGIGTHFTGYSDDLIPLLAKAGIKNVRNDLAWGAIEPTKGAYTFKTYDATMQALSDAGISVLPIADYTNPLYDGDATPYTDAGRAGFAAYAGAMLQHYKDQLDAVEVYNEFNIPGFGDRGDGPADAKAEYYAPLLAATAPKLKAADPDAAVVGPASAGVPLAWMETLFKLGGLNSLDAVSIHPYQYPSAPESVVTNLDAVDDLVKKYNNGQPKPLWITEQGWPTHTGATGVSEQTQAAYLVRAYAMALSRGVQKFFWYDFMNDGTDPAYNENNFGIIRNTGDARGRWVPKPAYVAYATMTRQLTGATFRTAEDLGGSTWSMRFDRGDKAVRVMWSTQPATVSIRTDTPVTVTDLTGDTRTYSPGSGGTVALSLSEDPVYVTSGQDVKAMPGSRFSLRAAADTFVGDPVKLTLTVDTTMAPRDAVDGTFEIAGTKVAVSAPAGTKVEIPVTLPAASTAGVRKLTGDLVVHDRHVARLGTQVDVRLPVALHATHVLSDGAEVLRLSVHNASARQVQIDTLDWTVGDSSGSTLAGETLAGGATRTAEVPLGGFAPGPYPLRVELDVADLEAVTQTGKVVMVPSDQVTSLAAKTITVDGTLDDLTGVSGIDLASDGTVKIPDYGGTADLSGTMWFTWDEDNLYLSARIRDDAFAQTATGGDIWQGDGIQFAVTPGTPGETGYGYEYGLALTPAGPQVYRWSAIEGAVGPVTDAPVAVRRDEANKDTVYELALPWSKLAPTVAADGMFSLSMLVNDNDGGGRKGYIEWGSGIGSGKDASLFKAVRLAAP